MESPIFKFTPLTTPKDIDKVYVFTANGTLRRRARLYISKHQLIKESEEARDTLYIYCSLRNRSRYPRSIFKDRRRSKGCSKEKEEMKKALRTRDDSGAGRCLSRENRSGGRGLLVACLSPNHDLNSLKFANNCFCVSVHSTGISRECGNRWLSCRDGTAAFLGEYRLAVARYFSP